MSYLSRRLPTLLLPLTLSLPATLVSAQQPGRSFERQEFQRRGADVTISAHGRLRTNRMAIGGETTGTELQTEEFTFDLDLSRVDRGRRISSYWNGERVQVQGELTRRRGPERSTRLVIIVRNIERVDRRRNDDRWNDGPGRNGNRWDDDRGQDGERRDDDRGRSDDRWEDEREDWRERWEELPTWYRNLRSVIEDEIRRN